MDIIIVDHIGEHKIYLHDLNQTLYDVLIKEKLLRINLLYHKSGKIVPLKLPLKHFKSLKLTIMTKSVLLEYKGFK